MLSSESEETADVRTGRITANRRETIVKTLVLPSTTKLAR